MSKLAKTRLKKYGISIAICVLLGAWYLSQYELSSLTTVELYKALCDAFTIPGMMFVLSGMLVAVSNEGALDGVGYVLGYAVRMLIPGRHHEKRTYRDYVDAKREKRVKGYGFLFIVGGICMAISLVFLVLFYSVYQG